jgi:hypothetical protein
VMCKHMWNFWNNSQDLKKSLPKHYFISFQKDLSNKNLVALFELLTTKIGKPQRKLYAIQGMRAWVPQHERNKVLQPLVNWQMIGPPPKPLKVWDSWKTWHSNPWR